VRKHLRFANVVSLAALFVALGGTSYAALTITGKQVKNRSLTAKDVKRNTLGGSEIKEAKLGLVPKARDATRAATAERALRADSAGRADSAAHSDSAARAASAANADSVGGRGPGEFVSADRLFRGFATARRDQSATVIARGPYTIVLKCLSSFGGGEFMERAHLAVQVAEPARTSSPNPEQASGGPSLPAGGEAGLGTTPAAGSAQSSFAAVGGYFDVAGGQSLDVSARLRVNHLGVAGCSAIVHATFGGL
jgi:hypothetical protein